MLDKAIGYEFAIPPKRYAAFHLAHEGQVDLRSEFERDHCLEKDFRNEGFSAWHF
jgi:hypothetical protein